MTLRYQSPSQKIVTEEVNDCFSLSSLNKWFQSVSEALSSLKCSNETPSYKNIFALRKTIFWRLFLLLLPQNFQFVQLWRGTAFTMFNLLLYKPFFYSLKPSQVRPSFSPVWSIRKTQIFHDEIFTHKNCVPCNHNLLCPEKDFCISVLSPAQ